MLYYKWKFRVKIARKKTHQRKHIYVHSIRTENTVEYVEIKSAPQCMRCITLLSVHWNMSSITIMQMCMIFSLSSLPCFSVLIWCCFRTMGAFLWDMRICSDGSRNTGLTFTTITDPPNLPPSSLLILGQRYRTKTNTLENSFNLRISKTIFMDSRFQSIKKVSCALVKYLCA